MSDLSFPYPPQAIREKRPRNVDVFAGAGWEPEAEQPCLRPSEASSPYLISFPSSPALRAPTSSDQLALDDARISDSSYDVGNDSMLTLPRELDVETGAWSHPISVANTRPNTGSETGFASISQERLLQKRYTVPVWLPDIRRDYPIDKEKATADTVTADQPGTSKLLFTPREMLFIFNVCLAQFLSLAGLAETFAPLVILSDAFSVSNPGVAAWPTAAYSLALGSCILPAGRLGDMFGHRRIFLIGCLWFATMSIICGFSNYGGSEMLTACRAFQGIGPALLIPNGLALFGRTFPMGMKRNIAISLFGGSGPCGVVSGAVISSLMGQLVWWPWIFWTMGIVCFCVFALTWFAIPPDSIEPYANGSNPWAKFDSLGAITGVGGLVLINFALNQAPINGWTSPFISVLLAIGILLMAAFVYVELKVAGRPLVPLKGLHRDAALTLACIAAGWGSHGIWSYYMFLLLEQIRGNTALSACSKFWPVAPIGLVAALSVGFILKKVRVAIVMSIAMFCFLLGCLFLATAPPHQSYFGNTLLSVLITPFGMNWSFPTGVILMSNAVPREHQGIAASLVSTMVNYSISTGLGFAGSINRYVTPVEGVVTAYRGAWYFGVGLAGIGWIISLYFIWQSRVKH